MFSWFKAKTPQSPKEWEILKIVKASTLSGIF